MNLILAIVVIPFLLPLRSRANDTLIVIKPNVKGISSEHDSILKYKIVSKTNNKIQFDKHLYVTQWDNQYGDVWILLEKKRQNTFEKVKFEDGPPPEVPEGETYKKTSLSLNDTLPVEVDLYHTYYDDLKKGEYRLKILVRASKNNEINDVESDWLYFRIEKDL